MDACSAPSTPRNCAGCERASLGILRRDPHDRILHPRRQERSIWPTGGGEVGGQGRIKAIVETQIRQAGPDVFKPRPRREADEIWSWWIESSPAKRDAGVKTFQTVQA